MCEDMYFQPVSTEGPTSQVCPATGHQGLVVAGGMEVSVLFEPLSRPGPWAKGQRGLFDFLPLSFLPFLSSHVLPSILVMDSRDNCRLQMKC